MNHELRIKNRIGSGQALVEVILAIGIMALVVVALLSISAQAISNAEIARTSTAAVKYAQEVVENLRIEREKNKNTFFLNPTDICDSQNGVSGKLKRTVNCVADGEDRVSINVDVSWTFGGVTRHSTASSILTKWK